MRAVRKDYFLDHDHSAYVDQWDWERVITAEQRNLEFLKSVVRKIWKVSSRCQAYESAAGAGRGRPAQAGGPGRGACPGPAPPHFRRNPTLGKTMRHYPY